MPLILGANSLTGGYEIDNSLRFDDGSSESLTKTFGVNGSRKKWVFSAWIKRTTLGTAQNIIYAQSDTSNYERIRFLTTNEIQSVGVNSASTAYEVKTNAVFRDVSAWYHIHIIKDSTDATAGNRIKIYVNGVLQSLNTDTSMSFKSRWIYYKC
jgi:hypothetical protein